VPAEPPDDPAPDDPVPDDSVPDDSGAAGAATTVSLAAGSGPDVEVS
jgi:hypothetical protein